MHIPNLFRAEREFGDAVMGLWSSGKCGRKEGRKNCEVWTWWFHLTGLEVKAQAWQENLNPILSLGPSGCSLSIHFTWGSGRRTGICTFCQTDVELD
jgi:hypothetical protein